jgi:hypothetical protein
LGQVAFAAASDRATGGNTLGALVVGKAIGAVEAVGGYAPADAANVGPTSPLTGPARVRNVAFLMFGNGSMLVFKVRIPADIKKEVF